MWFYPTLEVACVPASVEAAERVARAVDVGLAHAPAVGLHAVARGQVRQAVHRRAAPTGHVVVVVIVGKSDGEEYLCGYLLWWLLKLINCVVLSLVHKYSCILHKISKEILLKSMPS